MNRFIQEQAILYINKLNREGEAALTESAAEQKTVNEVIERSRYNPQTAKYNRFIRIARQIAQIVS